MTLDQGDLLEDAPTLDVEDDSTGPADTGTDESDLVPDVDVELDSNDSSMSDFDIEEEGDEPFGGPLPWNIGADRPFLMFAGSDIESMRERIAIEGSVAALLWSRTQEICDRETRVRPDAHSYDPYTEEFNANIARACAFEGLIGEDPALLHWAGDILLAMQTDVDNTPIDPDMLDKPTIHGGPAVQAYAQAFDLVMAAPEEAFDSEEDALTARDLLLEHADHLRDFYLDRWRAILLLTRNNHNIKHAAGIGMAALAVPDDEGALARLSFGVTELMFHLFESQFIPGGGYAEGPSYLTYSAVSYFPFLYALHRALDGGEIDLMYTCATVRETACQPGVRPTPDPWLDERFAELHRWAFHVTMPNGVMTPFDDSHNAQFIWPYVRAQAGEGPWMWRWHHGSSPLTSSAAIETAPDLLALPIDLEDWQAPEEFEPLNEVFIEGGQAVFRTGFDDDAGYVLLLGEHGKARLGGHEHPDASSFSWFVGGQYAFIDTGYFGYTDRLLTATADQHSLILVDGAGPPTGLLGSEGTGVDSFIEDCEITDTLLPTCLVRTRYVDTDVVRRLVMVGDRAVLLVDEVSSDDPARFTHLLHGGTPIENAETNDTGGVWHLDPTVFEAVVVSPDHTPTYAMIERVDTATTARRHAVLQTEVSDQSDLVFLTLLYRRTASDTAVIDVQSDSGSIGVSVTDGGGSLLSVDLCVDAESCIPGVDLSVTARDGGIFPDIEEDLTRHWALAGVASE